MAKAGRKGWIEELRLYERYSDLTEDYFRVLKEHLNSEEKKDQQWAASELSKGLVKMIPQDVTSGGEPINISFDPAFNKTSDVKG